MEGSLSITSSQICELLEYFAKYCFQASDNEAQANEIEEKCLSLFQQDYICSVINNTNGELCNNYPTRLVILEQEKDESSVRKNSICDVNKIRDQFSKARFARCRARFPLPVLLIDGKFVCRSSTLSGGPEIYGRSAVDTLFSASEKIVESESESEDDKQNFTKGEWQLCDRVRTQDIKLLKSMSIKNICDLMVENKKVKFMLNVTSSEKIDKANRYSEFNLISLPYPGCEFFREYRDCSYNADGLLFNWKQSHIDANIEVPTDCNAAQLGIDWFNYKTWDLVRLTQNYLRLVLHCISEGNCGILIHCISGWDRTPLFISLLRLSLWADGKIHQSLDTNEILYLTLAYDWFLCGHNLKDRLDKGEEILFFCFYFLKFIFCEDFSVVKRQRSCHHNRNRIDGILDEFLDGEQRLSVCGSNTSLSSNCSSLSYRSQENPPTVFTNADSDAADETNHQNFGNHCRPQSASNSDGSLSLNHPSSSHPTTSPVAVPAKSRKRSDSGSSAISSGSWQIITGSGSVRGTTTTNEICHTSSSDTSSHSRLSQTSLCDIIESEVSLESSTATVRSISRRERLHAVRNCFLSQYCDLIGSRGRNASDTNRLTSLIGQFVETVGMRSTGVNKPL